MKLIQRVKPAKPEDVIMSKKKINNNGELVERNQPRILTEDDKELLI